MASLRLISSKLLRNFSVSETKITKLFAPHNVRFLYSKTTLGLDKFEEHRIQVKNQMSTIEEKFREKVNSFVAEDSTSMIFTEDLKNMIHLSENEDDLELVLRMLKKFNTQNKQLRFGNFVFGPVLMRLFHYLNKPDAAKEAFNSEHFSGLFDQISTYQILLDLLYENAHYDDILELCKNIQNRQVEAIKYPKNVVVLFTAACFKLNTPQSLEKCLAYWQELNAAGHYPMRRASTFSAGLALNQGKPEITLELLTGVRNQNYYTVRNLKIKALTKMGRADEAIMILKSLIADDIPEETRALKTITYDVLDTLRDAVSKSENSDLALEFTKLEKFLVKEEQVSEKDLNSILSNEIHQNPNQQTFNRQGNQPNRYNNYPRRFNYSGNSFSRRPGLKDMA